VDSSQDFSTNSEAFAYFMLVMMDKMQKQNPGTSAALFQRQHVPKMWAKSSHEVKQMYKTHEMRVKLVMQQQEHANKRRRMDYNHLSSYPSAGSPRTGPGAVPLAPPPPAASGESEQALIAASAVAAAIVAAANEIVAPRTDNSTPVAAAAGVAAGTITATLKEQEERWAYRFEEQQREIEQLERQVQYQQLQRLPQSETQIQAMREMLYQKQQLEQRRQQSQLRTGSSRTTFDV
jgi:hypothetical protein